MAPDVVGVPPLVQSPKGALIPTGLKELDVVVFRSEDWVNKGIEFFQRGIGAPWPWFTHVGVILKDPTGALHLFQTNPPSPTYRDLDTVDWGKVAVLGFNGQVSDQDLSNFHWWADQKVKQGADPYGYPSIIGFAALGLLGYIPLIRPIVADVLSKRNIIASQSREVCSQLVDDGFLDVLHIDVLPNVGRGQAMPGFFPGAAGFSLKMGSLKG